MYATLQGNLQVFACGEAGCGHLICMVKETYDRYVDTHRTFYCPAGHSRAFTGKTQKELQQEAALKREQDRVAQEQRLRLEAEQRAGRAEEEKLKATRELNSTKRVLRNVAKTGAHLVKTKGREKGRSHHKKV